MKGYIDILLMNSAGKNILNSVFNNILKLALANELYVTIIIYYHKLCKV